MIPRLNIIIIIVIFSLASLRLPVIELRLTRTIVVLHPSRYNSLQIPILHHSSIHLLLYKRSVRPKMSGWYPHRVG